MIRKRVTLKDVAKAAGVSLASASYAVNKAGSLGEDTRAHILKVADKLGYRQNMAARATRTGKSGAIGFVLPDMSNPFFPSLAQAIVQRARHYGYSVFVTDTEGDQNQEAEVIRQLIGRGVDGLVWFPVNDGSAINHNGEDIPVVVIDRSLPGVESIQADYAEGGRLAADHLLAAGHQSIGIITGPLDVKSMRDRCDAAEAAIRALGTLAFKVENAFSTELSQVTQAALAERSASALFCGSDLIAMGVLRHARKLGLRVPEDLAVVGFDDIPWAEHCTPTLTTIEMPVDEMAVEAVDALIRKIDGEADSNRRVIFGVNLIHRQTS